MHKFLISVLLASTFSLLGIADTVDPIGDDNYKTVVVTVKQLDQKTLLGIPTKVFLSFGGKTVSVDTDLVSKGTDRKIQLTIPKRESGRFFVSLETSTSSHPSNVSEKFDVNLVDGSLDAGVKEIEIRLKRIDINDMVVKRPNGTTYVAKGSFTLKSNWSSYNSVDAKTGFGIDVPVGFKYAAKVSAQTEDGWDYYNTTLDFTHL